MKCAACNTDITSVDEELCLTCLSYTRYSEHETFEKESSCTKWGGYTLSEELGIEIDVKNGSTHN